MQEKKDFPPGKHRSGVLLDSTSFAGARKSERWRYPADGRFFPRSNPAQQLFHLRARSNFADSIKKGESLRASVKVGMITEIGRANSKSRSIRSRSGLRSTSCLSAARRMPNPMASSSRAVREKTSPVPQVVKRKGASIGAIGPDQIEPTVGGRTEHDNFSPVFRNDHSISVASMSARSVPMRTALAAPSANAARSAFSILAPRCSPC